MISSTLIILFSFVSLAGVVALIIGNSKPSKTPLDKVPMNRFSKVSLSFFTLSYILFLTLGITKFFLDISVIWLSIVSLLIIASRIMNGLALYGKNNWPHYIVTCTILLSIIVLHFWKL
ncbi:hypothetical protein ACQKP0_23790 [Heyndrickxia sp. NPDC080065]|uniref:hypothetical protein n=1 Tax=Heyndrickxia sp. NPDC080065 TaxID=3390568 RepID=UPI003D0380B5